MNLERTLSVRDAYTQSGTFDSELWYLYLHNKVPCRYEYEVKGEEDIDFNALDFNEVKKFFNGPFMFRKYSYTVIDNREKEEDGDIDISGFKLDDESYGGSLTFSVDGKVIFIGASKVVVYYDEKEDYRRIRELAKKIYETCPKEEPEERKSKVSLIKSYQGDYYTDPLPIPPIDVDIHTNYNDDFPKVYDDIIDFLKSPKSGLILLYGEHGTGKSTFIRHLTSAVPKEYIVIPNLVAPHLGDPDFSSFITDHKNSVFILEDCEQLLEDRANNVWNTAISTILNISDGFTGYLTNIQLICTFNAPVTQIDPALLRKGRCIAKYEFNKLAAEKVAVLNEKYDFGIDPIEDMTLAEVFNYEKADYTEDKKKRKIGF